MTASPLPNYLRTHRKRSRLSQKDIAFLLGSKSSAHVSRHERLKQIPNIHALIGYEFIFRTPIRMLFSGMYYEMEKKLRNRVRLLIRKLAKAGRSRQTEQKIKVLNELADWKIPDDQRY